VGGARRHRHHRIDVARGPLFRETPVVLGLADDERVEVRGVEPGSVVKLASE
jgi:hypothetical protein